MHRPRFFSLFPSKPPRYSDHFSLSAVKEILRFYGPDWVITIVLIAIFFGIDGVQGFRRDFSIYDPTIHYTYAVHERVPTAALYLIAVVAPLLIMPIFNILTIRSFWDFHVGALGLILGLAITGVITQFVKLTVGRPRPDLIVRCILPTNVTQPEFGLSTYEICLQTDRSILLDGWRSFPSGHASLSFAGLGFLSYYVAGKVGLYNERATSSKAWLSLTPLAGASLVAISRTMDYRHHWQDVIAGGILGLVMSYFAYRLYYPHLRSPSADYPLTMIDRHEQDSGLPYAHDSNDRVRFPAEMLRTHYRDDSGIVDPADVPIITENGHAATSSFSRSVTPPQKMQN